MKVTKDYLRKLIRESLEEVSQQPVSLEDVAQELSELGDSMGLLISSAETKKTTMHPNALQALKDYQDMVYDLVVKLNNVG